MLEEIREEGQEFLISVRKLVPVHGMGKARQALDQSLAEPLAVLYILTVLVLLQLDGSLEGDEDDRDYLIEVGAYVLPAAESDVAKALEDQEFEIPLYTRLVNAVQQEMYRLLQVLGERAAALLP